MSYDSGKIASPVSISDVQKALGVSANDLATLCKSTNINPFSKYKPVIFNNYFPVTGDNYWKAADGKAGVILPQYSSFADMINAIKSSSTRWSHQPPTSIFRLTDFNGYNANAQKPVGSISSLSIHRGDVIMQTINCIYDDHEDNLGLINMGLGDYYLSLAIMKSDSDTTPAYLASSPYTVQGTLNAEVPVMIINAYANELPAGTYPMYLFFSWKAMPSLDSQTFVPIDNSIGRLTIVNLTSITVSAAYDSGNEEYITYKVVIVNGDTSTKVFNNSYMWFTNDPQGNSINKQVSLGTVSVPAGQTKTLTSRVNDPAASPWVIFYANSMIQGSASVD
jgi:hypothetical protein